MSASRHLLVTGGCGFIGSNFVRFVLRERPQWRITNLDALTYAGNAENLADLVGEPRYNFVHGNICDAELVERLVGDCDGVIHIAAETHVDRSILDAEPFLETNVRGTLTLLDALRKGDPKRLVHVSTDEVYGDLPLESVDHQFNEESPVQPNNPYAATKASSDLLVRAYAHTHRLGAVITRCSNNFGPYQFPEKVIPLFVSNLLEGKKVPVYGDGLHVRDWLHVDDHCAAILTVLESGQLGHIYNVGANNERSNLELTNTIVQLMDASADMIEHVEDRPGHDRRYAIDSSKIRSELGWEPTRSAWPQALQATVDWYVNHGTWCDRIRSGEYRKYYEKQYGGKRRPMTSRP